MSSIWGPLPEGAAVCYLSQPTVERMLFSFFMVLYYNVQLLLKFMSMQFFCPDANNFFPFTEWPLVESIQFSLQNNRCIVIGVDNSKYFSTLYSELLIALYYLYNVERSQVDDDCIVSHVNTAWL